MRRFLIILTVIFILVLTSLPSFAASAGLDGDNYPTIPLYMELRFPDIEVFSMITDRSYLTDSVNYDSYTVDGVTLHTTLLSRSVHDYGVLMRKGISSDYDLAPIGLEISAPSFYISKHLNGNGWDYPMQYIKFPSNVYVEGVIEYTVVIGTYRKQVQETVISLMGESQSFNMLNLNLINQEISDRFASDRWHNLLIEDWHFTTTTLSFGNAESSNYNVLGGTWVLNQDFSFITGFETQVTLLIPFTSNGHHFSGITFEDTIQLLYYDNVGNVRYIQVWDHTIGWLNQEYRTLYFEDSVDWGDAIFDNGFELVDGRETFRNWLQGNARKQSTSGGYDGGTIFEYRYLSSSNSLINLRVQSYFDEWLQSYDNLYQEGYDDGYDLGYDEGVIDGYEEGYGDATGSGFELGTFLVTVVGGFFDFQIFPGFTLGGIFAIFLGVLLLVAFLKHFAGG